MFAADNGGEAALDGEYYIVTKDDKPIFKIEAALDGEYYIVTKDDKPIFKIDHISGEVTKPKGKKVLETLDPHGIG
jgi:antitoxin (DNA-binding transcriptional repressor) of toxin-antitoxin stability system